MSKKPRLVQVKVFVSTPLFSLPPRFNVFQTIHSTMTFKIMLEEKLSFGNFFSSPLFPPTISTFPILTWNLEYSLNYGNRKPTLTTVCREEWRFNSRYNQSLVSLKYLEKGFNPLSCLGEVLI